MILRAKPGSKVFSAGYDIDELPESRRDPLGWDDPLRQLVREIENFAGPVIAMVEGGVWGGATETVFACDMIIAADMATFAVTPAKLGVPYNVGGMLTFLNATGLRMAKEMTFMGQPIDAARAERHGIINRHAARPDRTLGAKAAALEQAADHGGIEDPLAGNCSRPRLATRTGPSQHVPIRKRMSRFDSMPAFDFRSRSRTAP